MHIDGVGMTCLMFEMFDIDSGCGQPLLFNDM